MFLERQFSHDCFNGGVRVAEDLDLLYTLQCSRSPSLPMRCVLRVHQIFEPPEEKE